MLRFVLAFALAFVLRFLTGLMIEGGWLREPEMTALERTPISFLLPIVLAVIALFVVHRLTPRRLLDSRVRRPVSQWLVGLGAGLIAAALSILVAHLTDILVVKAALTGVVAAAAMVLVVAVLPRSRSYACVHCGSVIPGEHAACPGCGAVESRGVVGRSKSAAA